MPRTCHHSCSGAHSWGCRRSVAEAAATWLTRAVEAAAAAGTATAVEAAAAALVAGVVRRGARSQKLPNRPSLHQLRLVGRVRDSTRQGQTLAHRN